MRDERGDGPAERPEKNADDVHEIATADGAQRTNRHEADEHRRERVAGEQNEFLNDVSPEHEQRRELADQPKNPEMSISTVKPLNVTHDVPPRTVAARVAFDDEEIVVLVLHVRRVNAQAIQDGSLQQAAEPGCPIAAASRATR